MYGRESRSELGRKCSVLSRKYMRSPRDWLVDAWWSARPPELPPAMSFSRNVPIYPPATTRREKRQMNVAFRAALGNLNSSGGNR